MKVKPPKIDLKTNSLSRTEVLLRGYNFNESRTFGFLERNLIRFLPI